MKKTFLLLLLAISLFAKNPVSFAALGDVVYDDIEKFKTLKTLSSMKPDVDMIDTYIDLAEKTRSMGFAVDAKDKSVDAKDYLKALRILSAEHDAIILNSRKRFTEAMGDEDSETINNMLYIGIIDPENYKVELIDYYGEFGEDHNLSTVKPMYDAYMKSIKKDDNVSTLSDAKREEIENASRIKRIRAKRAAKEEALNKSVKEEKEREKKKVLNAQKKELGIE